jgi:hypothetical protein
MILIEIQTKYLMFIILYAISLIITIFALQNNASSEMHFYIIISNESPEIWWNIGRIT